jgi:hypothetical protein
MPTTNYTKDAIVQVEQTNQTIYHWKIDATAEIPANSLAEDASFVYEEEQAVLKCIDSHVLPLLLRSYFFQQLDKSSLSYVSILGIQKDAELVGKQYS